MVLVQQVTLFPVRDAFGALLCFDALNEPTSDELCAEFRFIPFFSPPKPNLAS